MKYTTPQLLNVRRASSAIMGAKVPGPQDSGDDNRTINAYQSDE